VRGAARRDADGREIGPRTYACEVYLADGKCNGIAVVGAHDLGDALGQLAGFVDDAHSTGPVRHYPEGVTAAVRTPAMDDDEWADAQARSNAYFDHDGTVRLKADRTARDG